MREALWEIGLTVNSYVFTILVPSNVNSFSNEKYHIIILNKKVLE